MGFIRGLLLAGSVCAAAVCQTMAAPHQKTLQYTTRYDYNVLNGSECTSSYDLSESFHPSIPNGLDVNVNLAMRNSTSYHVYYQWMVRWRDPFDDVQYAYNSSSFSDYLAPGATECRTFYYYDYPICPGTWHVEVLVREHVQDTGQTTGWQTVVGSDEDNRFIIPDGDPDVVSVSASNTAPCRGETVTLTAKVRDAAKYKGRWENTVSGTTFGFVEVNDDCVSGSNVHDTTYAVPQDCDGDTIVLEFAITEPSNGDTRSVTLNVKDVYDLTRSVSPAGTGTIEVNSGDGPYCSGTQVSVTAVPNTADDWEFDYWSGDAYGDSSEVTVTMNSDKNVIAHFKKVQYELTTGSTGCGSVIAPCEGVCGSYDAGSIVAIIGQQDTNCEFLYWSGTCVSRGLVDNPNLFNTTVTMDESCEVVANFATAQYTLETSSTTGGTVVDPCEGDCGAYDWGEVVRLEAAADSDYAFTAWTGDVGTIDDVSSPITTIVMEGDYVVQAEFASIQHTLLMGISPSSSGTTDPEGDVQVAHGEWVDIVAFGVSEFSFDHWSCVPAESAEIENSSEGNTRVRLWGDVTVTAHFLCSSSTRLALVPESNVVFPGGTFEVNVVVEDVTNLYGHEVDIEFDSSRLRAVNVAQGDFLQNGVPGSTFWLSPEIDNSVGEVRDIVNVRLTPGVGVSGTGVLATIRFEEISGEPEGGRTMIAYKEDEAKLSDPSAGRLCVAEFGSSEVRLAADCNSNGIADDEEISEGSGTDCNSNGVLDECETFVAFDFDFDGDVDLEDYVWMCECMREPCCETVCYSQACCWLADGDADGDVDLLDFAVFQVKFDHAAYRDCNMNGISDSRDMAECDGSTWCDDCNFNGLLDGCEVRPSEYSISVISGTDGRGTPVPFGMTDALTTYLSASSQGEMPCIASSGMQRVTATDVPPNVVGTGLSQGVTTDDSTDLWADVFHRFELPPDAYMVELEMLLTADDTVWLFLNGNDLGIYGDANIQHSVFIGDPSLFLEGTNELTFRIINNPFDPGGWVEGGAWKGGDRDGMWVEFEGEVKYMMPNSEDIDANGVPDDCE